MLFQAPNSSYVNGCDRLAMINQSINVEMTAYVYEPICGKSRV